MTYSQLRRIEPPALEEELAGLLRAAKLKDRQARAVAARLGWDGKGACTLAVAAATEGYSRERVRQLEERVRTHVREVEAPCNSTKSALRLVEELAPIPSHEIGFHLALAGLSRRPFDVTGLLSAAQVLGIDHRVVDDDGILRFEEQAA
jgi:hypothetical protein